MIYYNLLFYNVNHSTVNQYPSPPFIPQLSPLILLLLSSNYNLTLFALRQLNLAVYLVMHQPPSIPFLTYQQQINEVNTYLALPSSPQLPPQPPPILNFVLPSFPQLPPQPPPILNFVRDEVATYLVPSSPQLPPQPPIPNFVRDKCKDITKYLKEALGSKQDVASWLQLAKILFKFSYKYQNSGQWEKLRDIVDDVVEANRQSVLMGQLYDKVLRVMQMVQQKEVKQVINLIEQNEKKRKRLLKQFLNQARRQKKPRLNE